jgi:hypothetical protein
MLHSYDEHVRQTQGDILLLSMRAIPTWHYLTLLADSNMAFFCRACAPNPTQHYSAEHAL